MFDIKDFYPTPDELIEKLISDIKIEEITSLLEPSVGKGNIVDYILEKSKNIRSYKKINIDVDGIEIDQNLRYICRGKGIRIVHDDFLTYNTLKSYSHIIANFPFSNGDKHLRKALEMLESSGGKLRCIVNAETIRNPYSNIRKEIIGILTRNNAKIEYLQNEFSEAERTTSVEIALIRVDIEKKSIGSVILDNLKQDEIENEEVYECKYIVDTNFINAIIKQYEFEVKAGLKLIEEYNELRAFTSSEFNKDDSLLTLRLYNDRAGYSQPSENLLKNDYIAEVRYKYWKALFSNKEFTKLFTSNLQRDFYNKLSELKDYDFTEFNINEIKNQLNNQVVTGVKDTIINLFDEFSSKHYWDKDSKNIYMFNGWKTNKAHKINKRVITRINGFGSWSDRFDPLWYQCIDKLADIEKVFNYLDTGKTEELTLREILEKAKENHQTKGIMTKFFKVDFYIKGSCHLTFLDQELLKKFNIYGAMNKGWLPPSYAKKSYDSMTEEEKEVVDSFEGKKEYEKVYINKDYYLYNERDVLMITN